ncbi:MAG: DNA polymerase III subunit gamma/tau [Pseudomonadota bacterium]
MSESDSEYRVLARKYRPANFDDLIGQEPMVRTLSNAFATNRIHQAYMLTGVRGVGKTTTARILARALNYQSETVTAPTLDLSTHGIHCASIMEGNHVDVIEMDAASHTGIDDIRDIIASVRYAPVSARYKVYIIDEVHMLSKAAFNGLLKTLEEPPAHVKFIFATTEIRKVPITVLSRCQRFDLRRIEAGELADHLRKICGLEGVTVADEGLAMIARAAEGSVRDALSLLDQAISIGAGAIEAGVDDGVDVATVRSMMGLADRARVIDLFHHVMAGDIQSALGELKAQYDVGADPATVLTDLAEFTHFVTKLRYVKSALDDPSLSEAEKTRGAEFAKTLSPRVLGRAWQMLLKGIGEVQSSPRPLAAADMVLVRLTHAADLPTLDEALKQLTDGKAQDGPVQGGHPGSRGNGGVRASGDTPSAPNPTAMPSAQVGPGGGGATMQRVAGGPALVVDNPTPVEPVRQESPPAPHLVAVLDVEPEAPPPVPEPEPMPEPVPDSVPESVGEKIETFADLLKVAEQKRDIRFKLMLRSHFSEISFKPGHIVFSPVGNAPADMARQIEARLREWTGDNWSIEVSEAEGAATIKQQLEDERSQHMAEAEADPVVASILKAFPRSKILDVRFPQDDDEEGLSEADVAEAALENPDDDGTDNQPPRFDDNDRADSLDDYF